MSSISNAMNTAVSGMLAQQQRAASTANNVANALTPGYDRLVTSTKSNAGGGVSATTARSGTGTLPDSSNVDLAQEAVDMIETTTAYKANASVFEAGADMWEALSTVLRE
ncbi:MAG TPA: flagellar basal body rod C-terminal domain-containing protein [Ensifer sp.]|nr:flagellar basal body rod C-terminal domain-containing protein [Ensifer sp.]